jgi:hypothetical protein
MPSLTISQPLNNSVESQTFTVEGEALDKGMPEPHSIDSVTVQVDGGATIEATLVPVSSKTQTIVSFKVPSQAGSGDRHTVTVRATNDIGISAQQTVTFFTKAPLAVASSAVQIELGTSFDPALPANKDKVDLLVSKVQMALLPLSGMLAPLGLTLAGPNLVLANDPRGNPMLRIGLWIVGPTFPIIPAKLPEFPLPVLSADNAAAGLATMPFLGVPDASGLQLFGYAISVPTTTLQKIVDATFPSLQAAASKYLLSLQSAMVTCSKPGSVVTTFVGQFGFPPATITATVTETLGTVPGAPSQMVPAVTDSVATGTDVLTQVLMTVLSPLFLAEAIIVAAGAPVVVGLLAGKPAAAAAQLLSSIPSIIPFRNTVSSALPDFPMIFLNWNLFGATNSGILARGTLSILERDQTMVPLTLTGDAHLIGSQVDLAGGASASYGVTWSNLLPDPETITWQTSGKTGSDSGGVTVDSKGQAGNFTATFPLPDRVNLGLFHFNLNVSAPETSGKDPTKKLIGTAGLPVVVDVVKGGSF